MFQDTDKTVVERSCALVQGTAVYLDKIYQLAEYRQRYLHTNKDE
ncbi:hypothetical protein HMPREF9554_02921 [Treponema phagedenis F0421]|nr:hypothetical protein HMPREF9554_02921 [Treponema phagedenis F0421]